MDGKANKPVFDSSEFSDPEPPTHDKFEAKLAAGFIKVATRGNIQPVGRYNPFPRTGLVAEHEKFIRAYVRNWCRPNPWARYEEILYEAIFLAVAIAEQLYDPQRGASFKTLLTHHFKSLGRRTNTSNRC